MGNKAGSRRKQTANDGPDGLNGDAGGGKVGSMKRSKSTTNNGPSPETPASPGRDGKMKSCPDLTSGAVPYRDSSKNASNGGGVGLGEQRAPGSGGTGSRQMEIKIYRSYTNVAETSAVRPEPRPDIRVYRRNTFARRPAGGASAAAADRSQTLPRGYGRHHTLTGVTVDRALSVAVTSSGTATLPRSAVPAPLRLSAVDLKRQSAPGLNGLGSTDARGCRRSTSTTSMASVAYRVTSDDFPDTSAIKRRLAQFETLFTRCLVQLYSGLSESDQLSSLSVAVRPDRTNQHISLQQYLTSPDVPLDLIAADSDDGRYPEGHPRFVLTIQPGLFSGLMHVRRDRPGDRAASLSVAVELLACLAAESAAELARIFEYQISLLADGLAIELLASQAAHCVIDYMQRSGRHLDRNTIVLGAIRGQHVIASGVSPKLSVIVGLRELKWEIHEILKKPGLRRELCLFDGAIDELDSDQPPWVFRTSYNHDPMLYGYRGLVVEWDFGGSTSVVDSNSSITSNTYRLNVEDDETFTDEMDWRPDDFHRTYCPYRRLVGVEVMQQFAAANLGSNGPVVSRATATLAEYVRRLHGDQYIRDQIQPICRPIRQLRHPHHDTDANQSFDEVFASSDRPVNTRTSEVPVERTPPIEHRKEPSLLCAEVGKTAEQDDGDRCFDETALLPSVMAVPVKVVVENSDEQIDGPPVTSDDSDEGEQRHSITMATSEPTIRCTDVVVLKENQLNGLPNNNHGDVIIHHHVTPNSRNGWPDVELADDSGSKLYGGGVPVKYVIEETTRKTIRSDI